ncbi:hypothetical protein FRC10_003071 [Ceratobasidium sp. 414]|nr:hypothetical protein FRC10_003071 [Ceratobasidium sp. 414]
MGKRKSSKKPASASRIKPTLGESENLGDSSELTPAQTPPSTASFAIMRKGYVTCKIDKKEGLGYLSCKVCAQTYQTKIHHLSEPIDVYSSWIDACDEAQASTRPAASGRRLAAIDSDEE